CAPTAIAIPWRCSKYTARSAVWPPTYKARSSVLTAWGRHIVVGKRGYRLDGLGPGCGIQQIGPFPLRVGEGDVKPGSDIDFAGDLDRAVMDVDDRADNGQPQPCAGDVLCLTVVAAVEAFEEVREVFRQDAHAGVFDGDLHPLLLGQVLGADLHRALARVVEAVQQQIGEELKQLVVVPFDQ